MAPAASPQVVHEWCNRIVAEYTSASITQSFVLWLMQAGAPPDLLDAGLVIVGDELVHSRMSHVVYVAAGGSALPPIAQEQLGLTRTSPQLLVDLCRTCVRVFCLGETVAVPLFRHLRARCDVPPARAALDRVLRDEVRHRDFGWDVLDWLLLLAPDVVQQVIGAELAGMFRGVDASYGAGNDAVTRDDGTMADADRAWGLAPPRDYHAIFERTFERDWQPRFAARGLQAVAIAAWTHRRRS